VTAIGFVTGCEPRIYTRAQLAAKIAADRVDTPTIPDTYLSWTPWTDTAEIATWQRGTPLAEQPTQELHVLDLRPDVVPTVAPQRRRRRFLSRADIAGAWDSALLAAGCIGAIATVVSLITLTRPLGELLCAASLGGH
jgi:hypothetical protein